MCWTSFHLTPKVAEKNIKVFKIIRTNNRSFYDFNNFIYEKGKKCPNVEIETETVTLSDAYENKYNKYLIYKGYHSYSNDKLNAKLMFQHLEIPSISHNISFLDAPSIKEITIYRNSNIIPIKTYAGIDIKVQEFIIPKGTKYYENEDGEMVSETIKMV